MGKKEEIIALIKKNKDLSGAQLSELLGISRQAVNRHLQQLVSRGMLVKEGVTRGAAYRIATGEKRGERKTGRTLHLAGLEEDRAFQQLSLELNLPGLLSPNAYEITRYAFTEMLNNAIDHSRSEKCRVELTVDDYNCRFMIRDYGIGLFFSIQDKFDLADENSAVGELLKGKVTTMREKHTGEGIFFTSKAADVMQFRSHRIKLFFDNDKKDIFIAEMRNLRGTEIVFSVKRRARRKLDDIFNVFAPEEFDFRFEKTRAMVKLFQQEYISRSEARRLYHSLDKFKKVILDFKGVKTIGQGFADELFRVFLQNHPRITFEVVNLRPALQPIVDHVVDNEIRERLTMC